MTRTLPTVSDFDAADALAQLRADAAIRRKTSFHPSRLDKFRAELLALANAGGKPVELQRWLRQNRIKVALSTVTRWLDKNDGR